MSTRLRSLLLLGLIGVLLVGAGVVQQSLNRDRDQLGLTRVQPLENAPPVLAFTTVALGGFRGLISNALWMRATDLQDEDKFFEMAQLADWITKLEPHFVHVWLVQAWNMAYNISVKFKESAPGLFPDRWRWVKAGIELLRDDGLRYNPNETLIYRELAWFFQHKIGQNLDDAASYYKQQWANDMAKVFDKKTPDLAELIHPQTADQKERARLLREKYKMDPEFMKEVGERYGPLEWRLPEAHAIYWAALGLKKAAENPTKVKEEDLITLRRVIYQSMLLSFQRGRLVLNPFAKAFEFGPNLDIIPKVNLAYEQAAQEDAKNRDHILKAHRNFLRDAVYFLYMYNRVADAAEWFKYLATKYPDKTILDYQTNSFPRNLTLDKYAVGRVQGDVTEHGGRDRTEGVIEGLLVNCYRNMVLGEDAAAAGFKLLAREVWLSYQGEIPAARLPAVGLRPFEDIDREVRRRMLDAKTGEAPEVRAVLRAKLGQPPEPAESPAATNAPPARASSP
jgi:hypothetical protein